MNGNATENVNANAAVTGGCRTRDSQCPCKAADVGPFRGNTYADNSQSRAATIGQCVCD